jgi:hypothetical protein
MEPRTDIILAQSYFEAKKRCESWLREESHFFASALVPLQYRFSKPKLFHYLAETRHRTKGRQEHAGVGLVNHRHGTAMSPKDRQSLRALGRGGRPGLTHFHRLG